MRNKTLIIVPAYNEEKSIGRVIEEVRAHTPSADILVVNDGSQDSTSKIAKSKDVFVVESAF